METLDIFLTNGIEFTDKIFNVFLVLATCKVIYLCSRPSIWIGNKIKYSILLHIASR